MRYHPQVVQISYRAHLFKWPFVLQYAVPVRLITGKCKKKSYDFRPLDRLGWRQVSCRTGRKQLHHHSRWLCELFQGLGHQRFIEISEQSLLFCAPWVWRQFCDCQEELVRRAALQKWIGKIRNRPNHLHDKRGDFKNWEEQKLELAFVSALTEQNLSLWKRVQHYDFPAPDCEECDSASSVPENGRALQMQIEVQ